MSPRRCSIPSWVLAFFLGALACHPMDDVGWGSALVGGECGHDHDCFDQCVTGKDFPDGTCTVSCSNDAECPRGTPCVDRAGGVCLLPCGHDDDCRPGYDCIDVQRKGHGGETLVCIHG
jgi:hypothetical protein